VEKLPAKCDLVWTSRAYPTPRALSATAPIESNGYGRSKTSEPRKLTMLGCRARLVWIAVFCAAVALESM
jgi:hypothetical protein